MNVNVELGGIIILMEEPSEGTNLTHCVENQAAFTNELRSIIGVELKEIGGPYINGVWAVTFVEVQVSQQWLIDKCKEIFIAHLKPIDR